jgi:cyclophilin family peptidyl-prolyl cis-trans isomerase
MSAPVVLLVLTVCAVAFAAGGWYTTLQNSKSAVSDQPGCEYLAPDRTTARDLPAAVDPAATRLVLQTDRGRIVVLLNGGAWPCAVRGVQSLAAAHRFDRMQCRPEFARPVLVCSAFAEFVYKPQVFDPRAPAASTSTPPRLQRGILTLSTTTDGYARGELVLVMADTAGSRFSAPVGEVVEGADVLARSRNGVRVLSATLEKQRIS